MSQKVVVEDNEPIVSALRRLRRRIDNSRPRYPLGRVDYYKKPSVKRRVKKYRAKHLKRIIAAEQSEEHFRK